MDKKVRKQNKEREKEKEMKVFVGGVFDILHAGHIDLFRWCRAVAGPTGKVIVGLNTDEFTTKYKGKPVMCYKDRKTLLESLTGFVDEVVPNEEDVKATVIKVKPDVVVVGSDWLKKDWLKFMHFTPEWLEKNRIAILYIPRNLSISTTQVKERIKNG